MAGRRPSRYAIVGNTASVRAGLTFGAEREGVSLSQAAATATGTTVGVRDIPLILLAPRGVFARIEDVGLCGWPLLTLLVVVTLIGHATIQTGLIDRQVDQSVNKSIAVIDSQQRDVVERSALREMYAEARKAGEFQKLLTRMQVVVAAPVSTLASVLLIAAVLYGAVALTGRKPEWYTLLTICVFAAFVEALRLLMSLALMLRFASLEVDTSLAPLGRMLLAERANMDPLALAAIPAALTAVDPFRIWFWLLIIIGLSATRQMRGWRAWLVCTLCWMIGGGVRSAIAIAIAFGAAKAMAGG